MSKLQKRHQAARTPVIATPVVATVKVTSDVNAFSENTSKGKYVTFIENANNTLQVIPNPQAIAEFIKEHSDHLPTDVLLKLNDESVQEDLTVRRFNVWGDDDVLKALVEDICEIGGWTWVLPYEIGALTDAPILQSPTGRIYWHERYQVEAAAEELLTGQSVTFDGAHDNKPLNAPEEKDIKDEDVSESNPVPEGKMSSKKIAEDLPPADSIKDVPDPLPPPPPVASPATNTNPYLEWQTNALIETIENLTKQDAFATAKPEQKAVEQMAEVLSSRPVEQEQMETKKASAFAKAASLKTSSTWMQDLKKKDPELAAAYAITGQQTTQSLRNMVKALSLGSNTSDEKKRLEAANYILGHKSKQASAGLDAFTQAYINAAFWSSTDESTPSGGDPLDQNYGIADLAPETLDGMKKDCAQFQADNANLIQDNLDGAGHDFWLTRNGHGAGFWDGDWPESGDALTEASKKYGEVDLYIGDDGLIYATGSGLPKAASAVPNLVVNEDTSKILEGDKSIPDGHDKVEDNTGIVRPKTDSPSKFASDMERITSDEDWIDMHPGDQALVVGRLDDFAQNHLVVLFSDWSQLLINIDPSDTAEQDAGMEMLQAAGHGRISLVITVNDDGPVTSWMNIVEMRTSKTASSGDSFHNEETGEVIEGDTTLPDSRDDVEDHSGVDVPTTESPSKFAHYRIDVLQEGKLVKSASFSSGRVAAAYHAYEDNRRAFHGQAGIRVALASDVEGTWTPVKIGNTKEAASDEALRKAEEAIDNGHTIAYDVAAEEGQIFGNVKHMRWFREAVADEIEAQGDTFNLDGDSPENEEGSLYDEFDDDGRSRIGDTVDEDFEEVSCPVGDPDCLGGDGDNHDACEPPNLHTAGLKLAGKQKEAAPVNTAQAIRLTDTLSDKLKHLYLDAKPISQHNSSRAVREAVESIYNAMKMLGEAQKLLVKQERIEKEELAKIESIARKSPKKSALGALGLVMAAAEEDEDDSDE